MLSIGPRRGLLLGRIVEMRARSRRGLDELLAASREVLAQAGAHALSLITTDAETQAWLAASGWRVLRSSPGMFFFHKDRAARFESFSFGGGGGDFGLEAFEPE